VGSYGSGRGGAAAGNGGLIADPAQIRTTETLPPDAISAELFRCGWPAERFLQLEVAECCACQLTKFPLLFEGLPILPSGLSREWGPSTQSCIDVADEHQGVASQQVDSLWLSGGLLAKGGVEGSEVSTEPVVGSWRGECDELFDGRWFACGGDPPAVLTRHFPQFAVPSMTEVAFEVLGCPGSAVASDNIAEDLKPGAALAAAHADADADPGRYLSRIQLLPDLLRWAEPAFSLLELSEDGTVDREAHLIDSHDLAVMVFAERTQGCP
jgi:hypothetical protein